MKKNLVKISALLGLVLMFINQAVAQGTRAASLMESFSTKPDQRMVAAHRGSHLLAPENSIRSILHAIEGGYEIVEIDVRVTKDKQLVIVHDKTIDRTTTGKGNVEDFTLEELKALRLLHDGQPTDQQIPTLEEALLVAKDLILVDLDFKTESPGAIEECYRIIRSMGLQNQVFFFVYDALEIPTLMSLDEGIHIMPRARTEQEVKDIMNKHKQIKVIHIDPSFYSDAMALDMKKAGIRIWANALGSFDKQQRESGTGFDAYFKEMKEVNIIQTDLPEELRSKIAAFESK